MEKLLKQLFIISVAISITLVNGNILLSEVMLRDRPVKLSLNQIVACVKSNNFFDVKYNPEGDFQNEFVDNGDGTITDRATGLMWERSGLNKETLFSWAEKYIKSLNKSKFAGYNDWRLPTVEELYTLLSPNRGGETFSDPILLCNTKTFWTSDKSLSVVDFSIYGNAMPGGQWVSDRKITINLQTSLQPNRNEWLSSSL